MCLADAVRAGKATRACLVLGGDGWSLRDYYTLGALGEHLTYAKLVRVVTLEAFIRLANNGDLWVAGDFPSSTSSSSQCDRPLRNAPDAESARPR
jgi:hypothetical protein